jgi:hypothetical protein
LEKMGFTEKICGFAIKKYGITIKHDGLNKAPTTWEDHMTQCIYEDVTFMALCVKMWRAWNGFGRWLRRCLLHLSKLKTPNFQWSFAWLRYVLELFWKVSWSFPGFSQKLLHLCPPWQGPGPCGPSISAAQVPAMPSQRSAAVVSSTLKRRAEGGRRDKAHSRLLARQERQGWWFQPLWKILVSWDNYSQYMEI